MAGPPNTQYGIMGSRLGFRLAYLPAALHADRETIGMIRLDDVPVRVRYNSVTIHDVINDTPNTAGLTIDAATPPKINQRLTIKINANAPRLLFAGPLQTVCLTYEGRGPDNHVVYPCQAIDDTPLANRKLPYGAWTNVSATTIAQYLVATFCGADFSAAAVQAGLPAVSVNFDASEGMDGCLRQLAKLIGGYFYWENRVLHLFTDGEPGDTPDPIDADHRFLNDPPIAVSTDTSQVRTRVYGKGYAEEVIGDVAANETIVPISNAVMFNGAGGQAVTETQRLKYTGTDAGGGGSLVGPGIGPAAGVFVTPIDGSGVTPGVHYYGVTFQTAAGESLLSPINGNTIGPRADPTIAPAFGVPAYVAAGVEAGDHQYAVSDLTASGETRPGPPATYTVRALTAPTVAAPYSNTRQGGGSPPNGPWRAGAYVRCQYSYSAFADYPNFRNETALSPASVAVQLQQYDGLPAGWYHPPNFWVPNTNDPAVKQITLWGFIDGVEFVARYCDQATNAGQTVMMATYGGNAGDPGVPYPGPHPLVKQVAVTVSAAPDPVVTSRKLYRTAAGGAVNVDDDRSSGCRHLAHEA